MQVQILTNSTVINTQLATLFFTLVSFREHNHIEFIVCDKILINIKSILDVRTSARKKIFIL